MGFRLVLASLLCTLPAVAAAQVKGTLDPDVWYVDTTVLLNGSSLSGPMPSQSKLCFAPEAHLDQLLCFLANHQNIKAWTASNITFVPPKNTPPVGAVILVHPYNVEVCEYISGDKICQIKTEKNKITIDTYKAHPHITQMLDTVTGKPMSTLEVGKTYEIQGYRFGDEGIGLYLGKRMMNRTDIRKWTYESILFSPSEVYEGETGIRVHNGAGPSNIWETNAALFTEDQRGRSRIPLQGSILEQRYGMGGSSSSASSKTATGADEPDVLAGSGAETALSGSGTVDTGTVLPFSDLPSDHPYAPAIRWGLEARVLQGYPDGTFRPDVAVSRAEFLKILVRTNPAIDVSALTEGTGFRDVDEDSWYAPFVRYAKTNGIIEGYSDGTFRPESPVNAAEALKMIYLFLGVITPVPAENDAWFARYLNHALTNNILFSATLKPWEDLTRRDTVWIAWKLLQYQQNQTAPTF